MSIIQAVRCPNCGKFAERMYLPLLAQVQTQCASCDYLLISCTRTGRVIEAYSPGLNYQQLSETLGITCISKFLKSSLPKLLATADSVK